MLTNGLYILLHLFFYTSMGDCCHMLKKKYNAYCLREMSSHLEELDLEDAIRTHLL